MAEKTIVQKIVLAGILIKEGRALLLKRGENEETLPGLWELPSGKKELLEGWRDALIREVREETGIEAEPVAPVDVFDYVIDGTDKTRDTIQISFLMRANDRIEVRLSDEHDDFAWITKDGLDNCEMSDKTRWAITRAFEYRT